MNFDGNRHYIDVDDRGRIVDGWSDGPHHQRQPTEQSVLLTDQGGYQFRLPVTCEEQNSDGTGLNIWTETTEENPALWTMDGIPLYKLEGDFIVKRTEEEIAADRAAIPEPPPSAQERMEAQVTYTAMMTDTLLEEG